MLIVDAQVHIWRNHVPTRPPHRQVADFTDDELLREMDEAGVDAAVIHPPGWDPASNAYAIEAARRAARGLDAPPIHPVPRDGELPLAFSQERMWFIHQLEPESAAFNIATAVRLMGTLDEAALQQAINALIRRHESLRTTIHVDDGRPVQ
ncbi:MAG: hypothetical protein K6T35_03140, partial [Meiothermus silvanus]|nr:hypothetical protein [Allomeiothermus silvanus]